VTLKPNGKDLWTDPFTGAPTGILHEVFFGNKSRDICVDYNIQIPVAHNTHANLHGRYIMDHVNPMINFYDMRKKKFKQVDMRFCIIETVFKYPYSMVAQAVNTIDTMALKKIGHEFAKVLKGMEY